MEVDAKPLEFDLILIICSGCKRQYELYPDKRIEGASKLIEWIRTQLHPCACGARTCDIKCRITNQQSP